MRAKRQNDPLQNVKPISPLNSQLGSNFFVVILTLLYTNIFPVLTNTQLQQRSTATVDM